MIAILQQLHEEDHFGIIVFSSDIVFWKAAPVKATKENLSEAVEYVRQIRDDGGSKDDSGFVINAIFVAHSLTASSGWVCFFPSSNQHQRRSLVSSITTGQREEAGKPPREKHRHDYLTDRWTAKRR